jgi:hypothetical protein
MFSFVKKLNSTVESISLDITNYWTSNDFLTESNNRCGTFVAFDWVEDNLTEINTNVNLRESELDNFKFNILVAFLKKNNFSFVLGLRNILYVDNPSPEWTDELKEILKFNEIDYDEYMVDQWPTRIPEFDIPDNIFILRYSYDEYSKIDKFAAQNILFRNWLKKSDWEEYYRDINSEVKTRVIIFCSDIENLVLMEGFNK